MYQSKNPIIVKGEKNRDYETCPAGMFDAVCYAVVDLGLQERGKYDPAHQIIVLWEIDQTMQKGENQGKRFVLSRKYTKNLGPKNAKKKTLLRLSLISWRGKDFTEEELKGFDLNKLVGVKCTLNVVHVEDDGNTYANIENVLPTNQQNKMTPENDDIPDWVKDKQKEAISPEQQQEAQSINNSFDTPAQQQADKKKLDEFAPASTLEDDPDLPF